MRPPVPVAPVPPPKPDPRTAAQIAIAACTAADGSWHCSAPRPKLYGAGRPPIIPASWTVPEWDFDPANKTTCASDNNTCTSRTCAAGGVGPCLTYGEVEYGRLGCFGNPTACPRHRQSTIYHWMSGVTNNSDPVYARFASENQAQVTFEAELPPPLATGTLSGVVVKTYATGQLLNATLAAGLAQNNLIINTTHPSHALLSALVSGTTWAISQPQTNPTNPPTVPSEVDTWANGDSYAVYAPYQVRFVDWEPIVAATNGAYTAQPLIQQLTMFDENGAANEQSYVTIDGTFVSMQDVVIQPGLIVLHPTQNDVSPQYVNVGFSTIAIGMNTLAILFYGGQVVGPGPFTLNLSGAQLLNDIILNPGGGSFVNLEFPSNVIFSAYIGSGKHLNVEAPTLISSPARIWGPGDVRVTLNARLQYPAGAGAAAATFLNSGGITMNGQTKACLVAPGAASAFGTCNIVVSASTLDSNGGTTSMCLSPGATSICNYGP